MHKPSIRPILWTDVDLLPEICRELELRAEVQIHREDDLDGIEWADAIIAGSPFSEGLRPG